mmetsp:Transcript_11120/g.22561  ORF Transcript_11120/g.22561 Transcript_11120/m.22561 type:complete len:214 (-) Transcript_11120:92-733(-)
MKQRTALSGKSGKRNCRDLPSEKAPPRSSARKTGLRSCSTNLLTKRELGASAGSVPSNWTSTSSSAAPNIALLSKRAASWLDRPVSVLCTVKLMSRISMKAPAVLHSLSDVYGVKMMNWLCPALYSILPLQDDLPFWRSCCVVCGHLWSTWMKTKRESILRLQDSSPLTSTKAVPWTFMPASMAGRSNLISNAARSSFTTHGTPERASFNSRG